MFAAFVFYASLCNAFACFPRVSLGFCYSVLCESTVNGISGQGEP